MGNMPKGLEPKVFSFVKYRSNIFSYHIVITLNKGRIRMLRDTCNLKSAEKVVCKVLAIGNVNIEEAVYHKV